VEALLRVYQLILGDDASNVGSNNTIVLRILTPGEQAGSLIDGQDAVINSIMHASQTKILVLGNFLILLFLISIFHQHYFILYVSVIVICTLI
jgi:hypothetical protein